jgi:hypothetical protein
MLFVHALIGAFQPEGLDCLVGSLLNKFLSLVLIALCRESTCTNDLFLLNLFIFISFRCHLLDHFFSDLVSSSSLDCNSFWSFVILPRISIVL